MLWAFHLGLKGQTDHPSTHAKNVWSASSCEASILGRRDKGAPHLLTEDPTPRIQEEMPTAAWVAVLFHSLYLCSTAKPMLPFSLLHAEASILAFKSTIIVKGGCAKPIVGGLGGTRCLG